MFLLVGKPISVFSSWKFSKVFYSEFECPKTNGYKFKVCFFFYDNGKQVLTVVIWDLGLCICSYIFFLKNYIFGWIYDKR